MIEKSNLAFLTIVFSFVLLSYLPTNKIKSTEAVKETIKEIKTNLNNIPKFSSQNLNQTFPKEIWEKELSNKSKIQSISLLKEPTIHNDWSEAQVEVTSEDGQIKRYLMVLHLEGGEWKIFGTEELGGQIERSQAN